MKLIPFYIHVKPAEINGCLAAQGGKLLLIVPNYTEVLPEAPKLSDESHQVFLVGVPEDEVRHISENGVAHHYVWKGDPLARSKPQDKATLEVMSLAPFAAIGDVAAPSGDPVEAAKAIFAGLPADVQLASIMSTVDEATLLKMPEMSPARIAPIQMWAKATVDAHIKAQGG